MPSLPIHPATPVADAELASYRAFADELMQAARAAIAPHFRTRLAVDNKAGGGAYDPVTEADRAAESAIRALIRARYPAHGIFGEEHGFEPGSAGLTWVIDPIDGTRAFISGLPLWGVLVALYDGEKPILGLMDQPWTGERFAGSRLGAELVTRDGARAPLATRPCEALEQAVLYSTHPGLFAAGAEKDAFDAIAARARLTRFGGDCYAYCMVAHGLVDLVIEAGLEPYDVAALIPIIEAAGGVISDWRGGPACFGGRIVAAGDPRLHTQALRILAQA